MIPIIGDNRDLPKAKWLVTFSFEEGICALEVYAPDPDVAAQFAARCIVGFGAKVGQMEVEQIVRVKEIGRL